MSAVREEDMNEKNSRVRYNWGTQQIKKVWQRAVTLFHYYLISYTLLHFLRLKIKLSSS